MPQARLGGPVPWVIAIMVALTVVAASGALALSNMVSAAREYGGDIDDIVFCPHAPDEGCECRKPAPGMLKRIAQRLNTDLNGVYVVGDAERDVIAARQVMAAPVLVRTGKGTQTLEQSQALEGVPVFDDLASFVDALLSGDLVTR